MSGDHESRIRKIRRAQSVAQGSQLRLGGLGQLVAVVTETDVEVDLAAAAATGVRVGRGLRLDLKPPGGGVGWGFEAADDGIAVDYCRGRLLGDNHRCRCRKRNQPHAGQKATKAGWMFHSANSTGPRATDTPPVKTIHRAAPSPGSFFRSA